MLNKYFFDLLKIIQHVRSLKKKFKIFSNSLPQLQLFAWPRENFSKIWKLYDKSLKSYLWFKPRKLQRKGNKGNTFLDQRTYKRAPLKRHLCASPIRSCLNEGGGQQTGREPWSSIKIQLRYDWTFLIVSQVPMNILEVFLA